MEQTDAKNRILDAAETLFAELGFEGTSVRTLAATAGVNVAMISYYFGSKEKLFEALVENRMDYMRRNLLRLHEDEHLSSRNKVKELVDLYVERIFEKKSFHQIVHRELSLSQRTGLHEMLSELLLRNLEAFRKLIRECQKKGQMRVVEPELVMATLVGTIHQVIKSPVLLEKILKTKTDGDINRNNIKTKLKDYLNDLLQTYLFNKK